MAKKRATLRATMLATFKCSGMSIKALADQSGVHYSAVHGFITSERELRLTSVQRICDVLELELVPAKKRKETKRG